MDFTVIHCIDLTVSLLALLFLYLVVKKVSKNDFIVTMLVMSMALMFNIAIFSGLYIIDKIDGQLFDINFYNWYSSFIRLQDCITVLWIAIYAWLRITGNTLSTLLVKVKASFIPKLINKIKELRDKNG
jgi:hypothetical protein